MVRKNIGSWKKRFQLLITVESWGNKEEQEQFINQLLARRRFPRNELIEVLANSYTIANREKRREILDTVEILYKKSKNLDIPTDLLELFKSTPDPELRNWIIENLPKFSKDASVPEIITLFRHSNRIYRNAAQKLLDHYDLDIVANCLAEELVNGTWANRTEPLRFLNEVAPDKILKPCSHSLTIGNKDDRITAVELLSELRTKAAMKLLVDATEDNAQEVRLAVARAVGRIPGDTSHNILLKLTQDSKTAVTIQALMGLRRLGDDKSIPAVVECSTHENSDVRAQSLKTLGEIGTSEHFDLFVEGIKDPDINIRQSALQATIHISRKEEIDIAKLISHLMSSKDVNVRRAAAQILGKVDAPELLGKVFEYLQDNDWWVREMVANSLAKLKDERVFPAVVDLLNHPDPSLRRYAVDTLISIGNGKAVVSILPLLKDQDWWVRERAVVSLGKLGTEKVNNILASLLQIPELTYV
ncbi:HEAT repeat domain-containing protein, partial [bacterium]|nr:HEAT repeat domain-containing protein [bacterium]